jgi:hypothetical protein
VNIVSNPPNFDSATLSPWAFSYTGAGNYKFVSPGETTTYAPDLYANYVGTSTALITQVLTTVPGETYTFSLDYKVYGGNSASFLHCWVNTVGAFAFHAMNIKKLFKTLTT